MNTQIPHLIDFKTSMGLTIKQFITEETVIKCKELEYLIPENYQEFEIRIIKLLMQDTYREF